MSVGLVGFGKTGHVVAGTLLTDPRVDLAWVARSSDRDRGRPVAELLGLGSSHRATMHCADDLAVGLLERTPVDVIIDFSGPRGIDSYGDAAAASGTAIVCAVSQFDRDVSVDLDRWARSTRVLWSPNITVGINVLMLAARMIQDVVPGVDVQIIEEHFAAKREVSGTAARLATTLGHDAACVMSLRAGGIVGNHEVVFGLPDQTLRLRHESISREAFGHGAVFAAEHLLAQPCGRHEMQDLLVRSLLRLGDVSRQCAERPGAAAVSAAVLRARPPVAGTHERPPSR